MTWDKVLTDFLIGGFFVALAVGVGIAAGAIWGGMIAALPIRLGITILISHANGTEFTKQMLEGALLSYVGTLFFLLVLYFGFNKIGLAKSMMIATTITAISIFIVFKLAGKI